MKRSPAHLSFLSRSEERSTLSCLLSLLIQNPGQWAGSYLQGCTLWLTKNFPARSQGEGQDNQNLSSFNKKSSFILPGNYLGMWEEYGEGRVWTLQAIHLPAL